MWSATSDCADRKSLIVATDKCMVFQLQLPVFFAFLRVFLKRTHSKEFMWVCRSHALPATPGYGLGHSKITHFQRWFYHSLKYCGLKSLYVGFCTNSSDWFQLYLKLLNPCDHTSTMLHVIWPASILKFFNWFLYNLPNWERIFFCFIMIERGKHS